MSLIIGPYIADRQYDGSGIPLLFSDMAIMTMHDIRQVFELGSNVMVLVKLISKIVIQ